MLINKMIHRTLLEYNTTSQLRNSPRYGALPVIEELQTAWEAKRKNSKYALYHNAITDGLEKLKKYYSHFDQKPGFILALGKSHDLMSLKM
jgi:hypothetical protein